MSQRPSIHELAELELNETAAYYEAQRPGLGADFLDELEWALVRVLAPPRLRRRYAGRSARSCFVGSRMRSSTRCVRKA